MKGFATGRAHRPGTCRKPALLEEFLGEHRQIDAPVAPDVAAVGLYAHKVSDTL